jgi:hypothetical protein
MTIDVIIPSTRREYRIYDMVKNWIDRCDMPKEQLNGVLKIWVACESEDAKIYSERLAPLQGIVTVAAARYGCYVEAVNKIASETMGDVIIVAADDVVPNQGYDMIIKNAFENHFPNYDGVLKANDMIHAIADECNTHPIIGRKYYERVGYVYYPGYFAMYADTDFARTNILTGRLAMIPTLTLEHWHHTAGKTPRDFTHEKPLSHMECAERLFNQRVKEGFLIVKDGQVTRPKNLF